MAQQSMTSNKSLHWPPDGSALLFCHISCSDMILASHEMRQLPGASELERQTAADH